MKYLRYEFVFSDGKVVVADRDPAKNYTGFLSDADLDAEMRKIMGGSNPFYLTVNNTRACINLNHVRMLKVFECFEKD